MDGDAVFVARRVGTTGHEIVGPEGVVAWAVNEPWAALIVALLNKTEDIEPWVLTPCLQPSPTSD